MNESSDWAGAEIFPIAFALGVIFVFAMVIACKVVDMEQRLDRIERELHAPDFTMPEEVK